jgi:hypothetical protein
MGLIDFPDPVSMFEGAKTAGLERTVAEAFVSVAISDYITGLWAQGGAKLFGWLGEGQAAKDMATACYLSVKNNPSLKWLVLTVPKNLLDADNLARFQTEKQT